MFLFEVLRLVLGCIIVVGLDLVSCHEPGGFNFVFCDESWDIVIIVFPVLCGNGICVGSGGSGSGVVAN